jgi:mRNA interferase YafQ
MVLLKNAIEKLEESGELAANKPHKLAGEYSGYWEAHIKSDWLIIWKIFFDDNEIWLTRTGTHSDLF